MGGPFIIIGKLCHRVAWEEERGVGARSPPPRKWGKQRRVAFECGFLNGNAQNLELKELKFETIHLEKWVKLLRLDSSGLVGGFATNKITFRKTIESCYFDK
jgi:hypothetical protein